MVKQSLALLSLGVFVTSCEARLEPCDIRDAACREDVYTALQAKRAAGWDPWLAMPPTRVITYSDYVEEVRAQARQREPLSPEDRAYERALQLLRLIDPDTSAADAADDVATEVVAAYYSFASRAVTIIDRGSPGDQADMEGDMATLAHELVHAAQDRELDLEWFLDQSGTLEEVVAKSALMEGDAVLYSDLVYLEVIDVDTDRVDWQGYHQAWLQESRNSVQASLSPYYSVPILWYPLGARHLTKLWQQGGSAATRAAWADSLPSTAELMQGAPLARRDIGCAAATAPDGFEPLFPADEFGALLAYGFVTRFAPDYAWSIGLDWLGDRLTVFTNSDLSEVYVTWQLQIDSPARASAVASGINDSALPELRADVFRDTLVVVAGDPPELVTQAPPSCQ